MENSIEMKEPNNIELAIQHINDISVYAERVSTITLHTAGVITTAIEDLPYAQLRSEASHNHLSSEYLDQIAGLVEQFGKHLDQAIVAENYALKRKEVLSQNKLLRRLLQDWQPMELMARGWITFLNDWYQYRIDEVSKTYLNNMIENIDFMEVENGQQ